MNNYLLYFFEKKFEKKILKYIYTIKKISFKKNFSSIKKI